MKYSISLFLALFSPYAFAYIDPGSGSFMLQMLIASLIGASFTIKMYFKNIKNKIISLFSSQDSKKEELNEKNNESINNSDS